MINKITLLILLSFLASCNQAQSDNNSQKLSLSTSEKQQEKTVEKAKVVKEDPNAYEFEYPDLEGNVVKLSDYRGKWVVANFWATWCPPCRKEIPDFVKFKNKYGDKIEILGINNEDADTGKIEDFAFEYEINYPILKANVYSPSEFSRKNTRGLPTTIIFNPQGVQVAKRVGPMHYKDLVKVMGLD